MQRANFVKVAAAAATALWLVGCTTTGGESTSDVSTMEPVVKEEVIVETQPVLDPSVQAVVDSGKISATPEQIGALLNHNEYQFGFDSSRLEDRDYKALDVQAAYLNSSEGRNKQIVIEGHTDERGTRTYNLALGERRASAVKNYLVSKGVAEGRIEVISFGFEKPLDPAHNDSAWTKNRRAVIVMN
ncbi:OmpA family protein [Endozoicomonas sp. Mp262]|uniref:OmpA family protein n=1 Tax=Endozoicomonas sp. Mp262 TaxID=2919499 RepID=UPI0021D8BE54